MPSLSIQYNPKIGPLIQVAVFPSDYNLSKHDTPADPFAMKMYMALIDTGASCTCISAKVIKDTGLLPRSKEQTFGVHGVGTTNAYRFQVGLMFPHAQHPSGVIQANIAPFSVDGIEFVPGGAAFDVLLGRDILCAGAFSMSFDGHAILSV